MCDNPKACGETHGEILISYMDTNNITKYTNLRFKNTRKGINLLGVEVKPVVKTDVCLVPGYDDDDDDDDEAPLFIPVDLDKILELMRVNLDIYGIIGCTLGMGGEYAEFFHCFILTRVGSEYYLTQTYFGEIDEEETKAFDFDRFKQLLVTENSEDIWTDIFGVEEMESGSINWELILTIPSDSSKHYRITNE